METSKRASTMHLQVQDVFGDLSRGPAVSSRRGVADQPSAPTATLANGFHHVDSSSPAQAPEGGGDPVANGRDAAARSQAQQTQQPYYLSSTSQRSDEASQREAPQGLLALSEGSISGDMSAPSPFREQMVLALSSASCNPCKHVMLSRATHDVPCSTCVCEASFLCLATDAHN